MALSERLSILITASGGAAVKEFDAVAKKAGQVEAHLSKLGPAGQKAAGGVSKITKALSDMSPAAKLGAGGALVAVGALAALVKSGADKFVSLTGEIRKLKLISGASAEDASKLRAVIHGLGVDTDVTAKAFGILAKNAVNTPDKFKALGVEIARNKDGSVDLYKTLLNLGDAYKKAGSGAEGTALALGLLGRGGAALLPILSKSRAELEEFAKAAQRRGLIFNDEDLQRGKEYTLAMRELNQAVTGLQVRAGKGIVPFATDFTLGVVKIIDTTSEATKNVGFLKSAVSGFVKAAVPGAGIAAFVADLGKSSRESADAAKANAEELTKAGKAARDAGVSIDALAASGKGGAALSLISELQQQSTASLPRIRQLADAIGVDLADATDEEKEKLAKLVDQVGKAFTPTERLADVTEILTNKFATASEKAGAMATAIDAALGVTLSADDATLSYQDAVDGLGEKLRDAAGWAKEHASKVAEAQLAVDDAAAASVEANAKYGAGTLEARRAAGHLAEAQSRLADVNREQNTTQRDVNKALIGAERAAIALEDAYAKDGRVTSETTVQKKLLIDKLGELKKQFPTLAPVIQGHIDKLNTIPDEKHTTISADASQAISVLEDLKRKFPDLASEIDKIETKLKLTADGSQVIAVLDSLKVKFPELVPMIDALEKRLRMRATLDTTDFDFKVASLKATKLPDLTQRVNYSIGAFTPPPAPTGTTPKTGTKARALGGPAAAHQDYVVGERGPELLRMGAGSGWVYPNDQYRKMVAGEGLTPEHRAEGGPIGRGPRPTWATSSTDARQFVSQSSTTQYNLNGPVVASDPAELERQLAARARIAALAGV